MLLPLMQMLDTVVNIDLFWNDCCVVQADDGYLYPLERAFFYIHKPPILIVFDEIESVEFLRQGGGLVAASVKTFDLSVRQRNDQVISLKPISAVT